MISLRDAIDEAITVALGQEVGTSGEFSADGLLHVALPCEIDVDTLVDEVMGKIREYAA